MKPDFCTVAVDVGNSALKLCLRSASDTPADQDLDGRNRPLVRHTIPLAEPNWQQAALAWVRERVAITPTQWRIASVHHQAADRLDQIIRQEAPQAQIRHITRAEIPIEVHVDQPDRVGIDRLLGAFAAWNRYHHAIVVVDAGSAITVDWVCARGHFQGGAILPGLALQTRALAIGTTALPNIDWIEEDVAGQPDAASTPPLSPAKNTAAAIRLGVLAGAAAAIDRLAHDYRLTETTHPRTSQRATVSPVTGGMVLTGGDAQRISPLLCHQHEVLSDLVCCGLLDLPDVTPSRRRPASG